MNETENTGMEITQAVETKAPETKGNKKKVDPFKKMIPIYLDKSMGGDAKYVYAGVNGRVYQVPVGMDIEVPAPIYDVLQRLRMQIRVLDGVRAEIAKENKDNLKLV